MQTVVVVEVLFVLFMYVQMNLQAQKFSERNKNQHRNLQALTEAKNFSIYEILIQTFASTYTFLYLYNKQYNFQYLILLSITYTNNKFLYLKQVCVFIFTYIHVNCMLKKLKFLFQDFSFHIQPSYLRVKDVQKFVCISMCVLSLQSRVVVSQWMPIVVDI